MTRLIYMGTPAFAVPALEALVHEGYQVVATYSQPPRPKNRGHQVTKSPIHVCAESFNIPVYTPTSLKTHEAQEEFRSHQADLAIVAAYGLILPQVILDTPRLGCINIHGSLLPKWRGAAPIHRAMLDGDPITGITLMQMDVGLDTGDMLAKEEYSLSSDSTFSKAHDDLAQIGAKLLIETLPDYLAGRITPQKQDNHLATYAHKLKKEESILDFSLHAQTLLRRIKTLNPWPGTHTQYQDTPLKIIEAEVIEEKTDHAPGTWMGEGKIACGKGSVLHILKIQRPGGKPLELSEFLRGFHLEVGVKLA